MNANILKNNRYQALWIAVHGLVFLLLGVLFLCGTRFKINTNLFDILPDTNSSRDVSEADNILNSRTGRMFVILVKDKDFESAKNSAEILYNKIAENKECFENVKFYMNDNIMDEVTDYYFNNRFYFLDEKTIQTFKTHDGIYDFLSEGLLNVYSGFLPKSNLEEDPFTLGEMALSASLEKVVNNGTSMNMHDGVLCAFVEDDCYVMIRGLLTPKGAAITNDKSGVKKIYEYSSALKKDCSSEFIFSGVPFHSYESSYSAQKEISVISVVSMILIIALCIVVFKSLLPVVCSVGAITMSVLFALSSVLIAFGQIHILTFVFGTTLIGTCLDYSVHFFVRWKSDFELNSGTAIRKHLIKGLSLSLASTVICYVLLTFSPFPLLKQVAVFSFTGILSSYLTVICLYPLFKMPAKKTAIPFKLPRFLDNTTGSARPSSSFLSRRLSRRSISIIALAAICASAAIILVIFRNNVRIENNLRSFYTMKGALLENEKEANRILNSGSNGWYFIVKGNSSEDVLEKEAELCKKLDEYILEQNERNMTYNSVTKYIPPVSEQKKSYEAVEKLLPYAKGQYVAFGYTENEATALRRNFEKIYKNAADNYLIPGKNLPSFIQDAVSNFWIGQVGENWYSVVMPLHFKDSSYCKTLSQEMPDVFFVNKMNDVGTELNSLTRLMIIFLVCAFIIMTVMLKFFYKWSDIAKIICIPVITIFVCIAVLAAANIPIGFFSVTGIVLVFGLSIDYIIYSVENSESLNTLAIFLSFISSALSFGALALSSFAPVFMFGLVVFTGLLTAVICTMLVKNISGCNRGQKNGSKKIER
ncbi:MMPL family transporter [Treponema sp.]|uniref:MMPL family transporter n=1 Tax=Treponema sp. TaxID=166 RepID=UPI00298DE02C|nr:MMPL family transporter [Treponema sp.]MCR5613031.1 MMPL family transporter [Treponema sp.]